MTDWPVILNHLMFCGAMVFITILCSMRFKP